MLTDRVRMSNGNKKASWVAVGDGGKITTSTNGIDWTPRTIDGLTAIVRDVAYGNGLW